MLQKTTVRLDTLAEMFDIPLWTLRKLASKRAFPGIIKKGRSIYVNVEKFKKWFFSHEIDHSDNKEGLN